MKIVVEKLKASKKNIDHMIDSKQKIKDLCKIGGVPFPDSFPCV